MLGSSLRPSPRLLLARRRCRAPRWSLVHDDQRRGAPRSDRRDAAERQARRPRHVPSHGDSGNPTAYSYVFWQEGSTPWTNAATARTDGPALVTVTASGVFTALVTATNAAGTSDPFAFQISIEDDPCFGVLFADQELPHATTAIPYDFRFRREPDGVRHINGNLSRGLGRAPRRHDARPQRKPHGGTTRAALPRTSPWPPRPGRAVSNRPSP